ncbi:TIGR03089 family protein [Psychromicrobium xiongbiense]|uniref:TIGR03089 family protein n=1 Tax=Psychromicrobium xiongbiense TaxID=3051184 RepID=UPI002556C98B|nr:TIGR03089 family protein [Psychromicrobium sp. YIM S02556]
MPLPSPMHTVIDGLLAAWLREPGSPRLTWYSSAGERVELSGKVLDNWVAKTANLLTDEFDAEPGAVVRIDAPAHWKTLCLALAAWRTGAQLHLVDPEHPGASEPADAVLASDAATVLAGSLSPALALTLPALAFRWEGELPTAPAGVIDYAAEVRQHGDQYWRLTDPSGQDTALVLGGRRYNYDHLAEWARDTAAPRAASTEDDRAQRWGLDADAGLAAVLQASLGAWLAGGSVVLCEHGELLTDRLRDSERITRQGA